MKSINLIPPRNPNRQVRTWLALAFIAAVAAGSLAGIYYYVDSIHGEANRYWAEAREVERQTAEYRANAVPRAAGEQLADFVRRAQELEASRIAWETLMLEVIRPLPQSSVLKSLASEAGRVIHLQADFRTYEEALGFIRQLESLELVSKVNVNSFAEGSNDATESVPVTNEEGAVLYYETRAVNRPVYHVDLRVAMTEGGAGDERQNNAVE